jgi:hypothetical protein
LADLHTLAKRTLRQSTLVQCIDEVSSPGDASGNRRTLIIVRTLGMTCQGDRLVVLDEVSDWQRNKKLAAFTCSCRHS